MHLKKRDMSLSETYVLAHTARAKLTREAARADHHLRLLVGHANMLDNLMLDLAEAEREREAWYNQAIRSRSTSTSTTSTTSTTAAAPAPVSGKRIQWLDTVVRHDEPEDDSDNDNGEWDAVSDSDSDDSSDYETDGDFLVDIASKRHQQSSPAAAAAELYPIKFSPARDFDLGLDNNNNNDNNNNEEAEEEYDDYGDYDYDDGDELTLTRTSSRQHQPPELLHDSDEESEDDMPPSPPSTTFDSFSAVAAAAAAAVTAATAPEKAVGKDIHADQPASPRLSPEEQSSFVEQGFFLPPRNPARTAQTMIAAF
ncbi:TPA_exp: Uncharacterized protein A8136_6358 [Trichophyton benhamiae CBS 112371]|uniref:Uncharacterized protein n=1 Tax=Arthroderma benhamiae (strain ATCC MYA-4681 / CBS 112371) TaxID=663331 RepID=D4B5T5_ARTBC|nr:uncharacterized protein ARB_03842 [Trichophyton benhamiae CBS 112371]EFE29271.1 conserved hypothetical protein [Trichophyton benhamiae CBS 112371]DAA72555.1 TPA_exp: Uncharacterized protein A8136_6358 [Trichophyton benhamiae CBS 112371]